MPGSKRDFERAMKEVGKTMSEPELKPRSNVVPIRSGLYKTQEWKDLRKRVLQRDGYRCTFCGADLRGFKKSRVDHIIPVKDNESLAFDMNNLRSLCPACDNKRHAEKGGTTMTPVNLSGFPKDWE